MPRRIEFDVVVKAEDDCGRVSKRDNIVVRERNIGEVLFLLLQQEAAMAGGGPVGEVEKAKASNRRETKKNRYLKEGKTEGLISGGGGHGWIGMKKGFEKNGRWREFSGIL
ncbi:hypothetical protein QQ045_022841 [Rhodiola kirilowii]